MLSKLFCAYVAFIPDKVSSITLAHFLILYVYVNSGNVIETYLNKKHYFITYFKNLEKLYRILQKQTTVFMTVMQLLNHIELSNRNGRKIA